MKPIALLSNSIEGLLHSREPSLTVRQKSVAGEVLAPSGHVTAVEIIAAVGLGQESFFMQWAVLTAETINWLKY